MSNLGHFFSAIAMACISGFALHRYLLGEQALLLVACFATGVVALMLAGLAVKVNR